MTVIEKRSVLSPWVAAAVAVLRSLPRSYVDSRDAVASRDWYASLSKPSFTPPDWIFGPAWAVLYALMALSS